MYVDVSRVISLQRTAWVRRTCLWQATIPMGRRWRVESILAPDAPLRRLPLAAEDLRPSVLAGLPWNPYGSSHASALIISRRILVPRPMTTASKRRKTGRTARWTSMRLCFMTTSPHPGNTGGSLPLMRLVSSACLDLQCRHRTHPFVSESAPFTSLVF